MLPWMRQDPDEKFACSILLHFNQLYKSLQTKEFRFEETLSVFDAPTLQNLRTLTLRRNTVFLPDGRKPGIDLEELEGRLLQYAASVEGYIDKVGAAIGALVHCVHRKDLKVPSAT